MWKILFFIIYFFILFFYVVFVTVFSFHNWCHLIKLESGRNNFINEEHKYRVECLEHLSFNFTKSHRKGIENNTFTITLL